MGDAKETAKRRVKAYPGIQKVDFSEDYFGTVLQDPYVLLEDARDPVVLEWVDKQNAYTDTYFKEIKDVDVQGFAAELKKKAKGIHYSSEVELGGRIFAGKTNERGERSAVVLDCQYNELETIADESTFDNKFDIFSVMPSPADNGLCILMVLGHGAARPSFLVFNYRTIELIGQIDHAFSAVWSGDGERVYYADTQVDNTKSINVSCIRTLNSKTKEEETILVYEKPATFIILKAAWESGYVFAEANSDYANNELLAIKDRKGEKTGISLSGSLLGSFTYIGTTNGKHYVITNCNAPYGKIMAVDVMAGACEHAVTVIPEREGIIQGAAAAEGKMIVSYMKDVVSEVAVFDDQGAFVKTLILPSGMGTTSGIGGFGRSMPSAAGNIYFTFESFTDPLCTLRYNMKIDELKTVYVPIHTEVKADLVVKRVFVTVRDGTKVPAFIVHRKDLVRDGNNPTLMYGYGGYNVPLPPAFENPFIGINIHEWVENGYVYVNCNIRGGNEYGTTWHEAGNLGNKKNVFFDFIDIAEWLIEYQWTKPKKIAICGGSNGGLLMTALTTLRPDLWGAVIASVPHTDMIRFKNDDRGTMYVTEYGDPTNEDMFRYLLSYSPYHNIKKVKYPPMYLQTGERDNNVPSYHAKKFAAKMQELDQSGNPVLLRVLPEGAHDRGKGDVMYKTFAEMQTFIAKTLKLD